jgi:hypothetical protein
VGVDDTLNIIVFHEVSRTVTNCSRFEFSFEVAYLGRPFLFLSLRWRLGRGLAEGLGRVFHNFNNATLSFRVRNVSKARN